MLVATNGYYHSFRDAWPTDKRFTREPTVGHTTAMQAVASRNPSDDPRRALRRCCLPWSTIHCGSQTELLAHGILLVRQTLSVPIYFEYSKELDLIPLHAYHRLSEYRRRCGDAIRAHIGLKLSDGLGCYGTNPFREFCAQRTTCGYRLFAEVNAYIATPFLPYLESIYSQAVYLPDPNLARSKGLTDKVINSVSECGFCPKVIHKKCSEASEALYKWLEEAVTQVTLEVEDFLPIGILLGRGGEAPASPGLSTTLGALPLGPRAKRVLLLLLFPLPPFPPLHSLFPPSAALVLGRLARSACSNPSQVPCPQEPYNSPLPVPFLSLLLLALPSLAFLFALDFIPAGLSVASIYSAGGVGKSALVMRYGQNKFLDRYDPTIEEEYEVTVEYEGRRSVVSRGRSQTRAAHRDATRRIAKLNIIDTAGVEQFTGINENYIQRGVGFVLVFSLTQEASLRELDHIRQHIYRIKGGEQDIPIIVVGTKMDLTAEREVSSQTMQELAVKWGLPFYETSAKKGWHVSEVFNDLLLRMRKRYPNAVPYLPQSCTHRILHIPYEDRYLIPALADTVLLSRYARSITWLHHHRYAYCSHCLVAHDNCPTFVALAIYIQSDIHHIRRNATVAYSRCRWQARDSAGPAKESGAPISTRDLSGVVTVTVVATVVVVMAAATAEEALAAGAAAVVAATTLTTA
ncbi:hypothetical protein NUW54_g8610 [Trametes sanguinea]|uniref:Uncharacterized protein n=1 Tax=Trametes sanguinea TaxID=158606 RepID=A0ACC1PEI1_9APHY|nr:hypothetical protein NUW54_g8610 [Trametes sanguinea]